MRLNAINFNQKRKSPDADALKRIHEILACVINSYEKIRQEIMNGGKPFDYAKRGKIKHEDFLRNRLVDDYLKKELNLLKNGTLRFTTNKETSEEYISLLDNELHNDPIDIQIVLKDRALQESWGKGENVYFAIECKRIRNAKSISEYVKDTKKFTEREYTKLRLPFEGQLGFIEHKTWYYSKVSQLIEDNLESNVDIKTIVDIKTNKLLKPHKIKNGYDGSYLSQHKKKNDTKFSVFHLFFDYSNLTING